MRSQRLIFIFLAFYLVFIGGSAYYTLIFPVRIIHHGVMTLFMAMWYIRKIRGDGLPQTPLNIPLALMCGVWGLSAIFGIEPRNSIESGWFMLVHVTLFFVLADLFGRGRGRLVLETQFFMSAIVILFSVIEIASWYFGLGITPNTHLGWASVRLIPPEPIRLALALNISTLLAGYVAPLILLILGWALTARRRDYRQALWLMAGALTVILILTFSRGGLLSFGVGLASFLLMRLLADSRKARLARWFIPLAIIGGIGLVTIFTISQTRSSGDEGRLDMYRSALEITRDNPLIGVGIGNYGRAFREYRTPEQARDRLASAHNLYLNTASETGFIGIMVGLWLGGTLVMTWWRVWRAQSSNARKIRQEAVIASLIGVGVHSIVDVFTTTPLVSLLVLLVAYSIIGHRTVLDERPQGRKIPAMVALIFVVSYGIFFIQTDRAYASYLASLRVDDAESALALAQEAQSLDPELTLYTLHIAYLTDDIPTYQSALQSEPTWDVGWMNLAHLYEQAGEYDKALEALSIAQRINPLTEVHFNIGRIGELYGVLDDETIIAHYLRTMQIYADKTVLSGYWSETALRREVLIQYLSNPRLNPILHYQTTARHFPNQLADAVPNNPQTAFDWWVVGEYALTTQNDAQTALEAFTMAINLALANGDMWAGRARAKGALGDMTAEDDLRHAQLLGVRYERFDTQDDEIETSYVRANNREFTSVLYHGRAVGFDLKAEMRVPH